MLLSPLTQNKGRPHKISLFSVLSQEFFQTSCLLPLGVDAGRCVVSIEASLVDARGVFWEAGGLPDIPIRIGTQVMQQLKDKIK